MPRRSFLSSLTIAVFIGLALWTKAAEQVLVVGDSLTKEYQVEFPLLYPNNPASWVARNWVELLNTNRNSQFDLGTFGFYSDPRLSGHRYNWAFPGATTQEIRDQLASTSISDLGWLAEFEDQVKNVVERVVVFAGGNDVDDYYDDIYNGASAAAFTNVTLNNLEWIVDRIRGYKSTIPIVLVAVPHVGCTPKIQLSQPTNAVKTARVTAALDALNAQLAAFAQSRNIGFATGAYDITKALITDPCYIGGVEFKKQADMNAGVRYLFSGDGFHPNTCAQARVAQGIISAFRASYPSPDIPAASDDELLGWLGLDPLLGLQEWLAAASVPSNQRGLTDDSDLDGISNLMEFLLSGMDASKNSMAAMPKAMVQNIGGQNTLTFTWQPSAQGLSFGTLTLLQSLDLTSWSGVPGANITKNADGSFTARISLAEALFLRLAATR